MIYKNINKIGRPLRVLHIGNIANNAYKNALLMRRHGIEADVLCYDYYHIMGCPEWEDGEFQGEVDDFFPDWFSTSLRGWSRPDWFVQGPATTCLQFLRARRCGMFVTSWILRQFLEARYWEIVEDAALAKGIKRRGKPFRYIAVKWLVQAMGIDDDTDHGDRQRLLKHLKLGGARDLSEQAGATEVQSGAAWSGDLRGRADAGGRDAVNVTAEIAEVVVPSLGPRPKDRWSFVNGLKVAYGLLFDITVRRSISKGNYTNPIAKSWLIRKGICKQSDLDTLREKFILEDSNFTHLVNFYKNYWKNLHGNVVKERFLFAALRFIRPIVYRLSSYIRKKLDSVVPQGEWAARFPKFIERRDIILREAESFPEVEIEKIKGYVDSHPLRFLDVLKSYDIVQGYATDGLIPWMNGLEMFASYEHGTIRDIPWERSLTGAVCKAVYQHSPAVFVTNSDVIPSIAKLGIDPSRVAYVPHGFDDSKLRGWMADHPDEGPRDGTVQLFCPARQHWASGDSTIWKGNNILIEAIARLAQRGGRIRATFVEWGVDVAASKELIRRLGIEDLCDWVKPLRKQALWAAYRKSHAIADQFIIPAFGGTPYEAMALGRRVITRIDDEQLTAFFGARPPVFSASDVAGTVQVLEKLIADPTDSAGIGLAGQDWVYRYHSPEHILKKHLEVYDRLLASRPSQAS